ncbi:putative cytochrome p450 protein [Neofusicoccum parvum]|uniref:Cytochrome p450 protein n=1 Tax=Neofusicoccum parvum TaxID=310453 RepID=A0ACB5RS53_9PEZI|nr:putative cytochrome p450 protein [Neofusicoccum parvum]
MAVLASLDYSLPQLLGFVLALATSYGLYAFYAALTSQRPYRDIPLIDKGDGGLEEGKRRFIADSRAVVGAAVKQAKGAICQIYTDAGPKILLDTKHIPEIGNDPNFSFAEFVRREMMTDSAFKDFSMGHRYMELFKKVVRVDLTQALPKLTVALSEETALAMSTLFPPSADWTPTPQPVYPLLVALVSQLSARAFLGAPICRDPAWLRISATYTRDMFLAVQALRRYPPWLRPAAQRFWVPQVRTLREVHGVAHAIVQAELARRRGVWAEQAKAGEKKPARREKPVDTLQWFEDAVAAEDGVQVGAADIANAQLSLTMAAIHTTSSALTHALLDLAARPALVDELRREIVDVLGSHASPSDEGTTKPPAAVWQKTSLYRLRLLDSVLKESQRLNPTNLLSVKRVVTAPTVLADGTRIPRGAAVAVPVDYMIARPEYAAPPPDTFDGRRFVRLREHPGEQNRWQYATTSKEHFGFGVGAHSCPGRFFASNELKIALVHALVRYDWRFVGEKQGVEGRPRNVMRVDQIIPDQTAKLEYRERVPEIVL